MNSTWKKIKSLSISNLNVLVVDGIEVGFICKPKDSKTDKNMWRVFRGIGENSKFYMHVATKALAVKTLEHVYGGNTIVDQKG
jgi:hypothetical protein